MGSKYFTIYHNDGNNITYWDSAHAHIRDECTYKFNLLNGECVSYYKNGQKKSEIEYHYGRPHGKCLKWYENGNKELECAYNNDTLVGDYKSYWPNGDPDSIAKYDIKLGLQGEFICYDVSGHIIKKTFYRSGLRNGEYIEVSYGDHSEKYLVKCTYINDTLNGLYEKYRISDLYRKKADTLLLKKAKYNKGILNGQYEYYYFDYDYLCSRKGSYINGIKEGLWTYSDRDYSSLDNYDGKHNHNVTTIRDFKHGICSYETMIDNNGIFYKRIFDSSYFFLTTLNIRAKNTARYLAMVGGSSYYGSIISFKDGKLGLVDTNNTVLFPFVCSFIKIKYDSIYKAYVYGVEKDGKYYNGLMSYKGDIILGPKYEFIEYLPGFNFAIIKDTQNNRVYKIYLNNKTLKPWRFGCGNFNYCTTEEWYNYNKLGYVKMYIHRKKHVPHTIGDIGLLILYNTVLLPYRAIASMALMNVSIPYTERYREKVFYFDKEGNVIKKRRELVPIIII